VETRRLLLAASGAVAAVALGTWLLSGVSLRDAVLFCGYHALWVVLPGLGLHRLLDREAAGLERLVVGWSLGSAVAVGAFHLTAALGARWLFHAVPLLGLTLLARRRGTAPSPLTRPAVVGLACVAAAAIVLQALAFVPLVPLPGTTSAAYPPDPMFHLAVVAEALHHFPVTDQKVAGTALPYHLFAHYDMAGAAQVTGIELPVLVFRLAAVPLLVLGTLAVGLLSLRAGAVRAGVPLASALFLFAGEVDLQPRIAYPFWGGSFFGLTFSPSFLLAVPLFAALVAVVLRLLDTPRPAVGLWVVAGALAWAVGGAKGGSLAVLVGGCLLHALVRRDRRALAVAALGGAVAAVQLVVVYGGAGEGNLDVRLLGAVRSSSAVDALANWLAVVGPIGTLLAIAFGLAALLAAPLAAAAWAPRDGPAWTLLASLTAAGLVPLLLLTHRGESQLYLTQLGLTCAAALGGAGLERLFARARGWALAAVGVGVALALLGVAYLPSLAGAEGQRAHALWYGGTLLVCAAAATAAAALLGLGRGRAVVLVVLVAAAINVPLDALAPLARDGRLSAGDDVTRELHEGLVWVRERTPTDAVLAVNVHDTNRGRFDNFVPAALAERRVFLGGWLYSILTGETTPDEVARGAEHPFPERMRVNDGVFAGDAEAAAALVRDHGVDYLVVDKLHAHPDPRVAHLGEIVFSNAAVDVVRLRRP
jgi:hypothetical protein